MTIRGVLILVLLLAAIIVGLRLSGQPTWRRETPLLNPITVVEVTNGILKLEDGRELRPVGILQSVQLTPEEWDEFLGISVAQGVVVERELGNGLAMLSVEPRFYNSCGTSQRDLNWAGDYVQCGLSELAIACGYAEPDLTHSELSALDRWRLQGSMALRYDDELIEYSNELNAFRYDSMSHYLNQLDETVEWMTDTPKP